MYLKFTNLKTGLTYCTKGQEKDGDGNPTDCVSPTVAELASGVTKYRPEVLVKCVCAPGTECNSMIAGAGVASTIFVRIALGTPLERFGPVNVQSGLLTFRAIWVAAAAGISAPWNYTLIRFFIGDVRHEPVLVLPDVRSERHWHGERRSCPRRAGGRGIQLFSYMFMLVATSRLSGAKANQPRKARKKEIVDAQKARMCGFCCTIPQTRSSGSSVALLFSSTANLKSDISAGFHRLRGAPSHFV